MGGATPFNVKRRKVRFSSVISFEHTGFLGNAAGGWEWDGRQNKLTTYMYMFYVRILFCVVSVAEFYLSIITALLNPILR